MQGGEGSRGNAGDPVVVQRQETHRAQTCKCAVVNAADLVAPQHSGNTHATYMFSEGNLFAYFVLILKTRKYNLNKKQTDKDDKRT